MHGARRPVDLLEAAVLGHRRLEQELRREQAVQLLGRGHAAGLVVDDLPAARLDLVDAVGARLDATVDRGPTRDRALGLARQQLGAGARGGRSRWR